MSARRHLIAALSEDSMGGIATLQDVDRAEHLVDAHRAEVLAETIAWLGKEAREFRAVGTRKSESQANAVAAMASKISRGAVRPNNTWLPAGVKPTFFEPGFTYRDGDFWAFRCDTVTTRPDTGELTALGWRFFRGEWEACAYRGEDWEGHQAVGYTEVIDGGEVQ
ncbi:hypothetical protein [Streptomyces sp. 1222.5]|uniref:hypothetical protein n=1 Tax=Streptomyces sp. 1222.5 TaxID=1881026 RepID=UPI003EBD8C97